MSQQYWIGTVSKEHVLKGKAGGFAQVCHGKQAPLKRMQANDLFLYYSPNEYFGEKIPYQCFTALGVVLPGEPYSFKMSEDFIPFRKNIEYIATVDAPIRPLIPQLSFLSDKIRWGAAFRFGILKIPREDCLIIANAMGLTREKIDELFI